MARITMPQLGETVTEGTVTRWLKSEGDEIRVDEPLLEVSTDKVETEIPSAFAGTVRRIVVGEGDTVPIGSLLAIVGDGRRRRRRPTEADPRGAAPGPPAGQHVGPRRSDGSSRAARATCTHPCTARDATADGRSTRAASRRDSTRAPSEPARPSAAASRHRRARGGRAHPLLRHPPPHRREPDRVAAHRGAHADGGRGRLLGGRRRRASRTGPRGGRATGSVSRYLPFIARAVCAALGRVRAAERLGRRRRARPCIATSTWASPSTSTSRASSFPSSTTPSRCAGRSHGTSAPDLADRARGHHLSGDDIAGGTFTITNAGRVRHRAHRADHQPAAGRDPLDRRCRRPDPSRSASRTVGYGVARAPGGPPVAELRSPGERRRVRLGVPRPCAAGAADAQLARRSCPGRASRARGRRVEVPPDEPRRAHRRPPPRRGVAWPRRQGDRAPEAEPGVLPDLGGRARGPAPRPRP